MLLDLKHSRALRRQHLARKTPLLIFTAVDVARMAEDLRQAFFPTVPIAPDVIFVNGSFLGCISPGGSTPQSLICLHAILNRADVPALVFRHILTHELIHLVVAPREVGGKLTSHPPEFWELERDLCPGRNEFWRWVGDQFRSCLIIDRKNECIKIKRGWRKALQSRDATVRTALLHFDSEWMGV